LHGLCSQESRLAVARWLRSPALVTQLWASGRAPAGGRRRAGNPVYSRLGKHRPPARCGQPRRLPGGTTAELSDKPTVNAHRVPERALRQAPAIT
jgi:hypothetical protein